MSNGQPHPRSRSDHPGAQRSLAHRRVPQQHSPGSQICRCDRRSKSSWSMTHSTDETSDVARAHGAFTIRQSRRLGQMAACSLGVVNSSASLIFFVDADCRVDKGAFSALLRGFARPTVGVVAARSEPETGPPSNRSWNALEPSARIMLHETKSRLVNHDFLPIGRLFALRRAAWQAGDHRSGRATGSTPRAQNALGGKSSICPKRWCTTSRSEPTTNSGPTTCARQIHTRARLIGDWAEPLPRGAVCRAASASLRRQPLNAAAWLALRMRLWSERVLGLMRLGEGFGSSGVWERLPHSSRSHSRPRARPPDP